MKKTLVMLTLVVSAIVANAQKFHQPFYLTQIKDADVVLNDGTVLTDMRIKGMKTKKGIAKSISVGNDQTAKKQYKVEEIKTLKGKPKGLAKINAVTNTSITNAAKTDYGSASGKDDLIYEQVTMPKGAKVKVTLLQLLNPDNSSKMKVYADPLMKKSSSFAGGLVGGELKSFYIQVGNGPLYYVKGKSAYRKQFKDIYKSCPNFESDVVAKFKGIDVLDLTKHVALLEEKCQ